jgi:hypothetical protein
MGACGVSRRGGFAEKAIASLKMSWKRPRRQDAIWRAAPKVRAPGARKYLLFSGPLSVLEELAGAFMVPPLNMWWPDDRAWLVSTEVDSITSYVGASQDAIPALLAEPDLDVADVDIHARLDPRA